jgi:hypothetical protein
METQNKDNDTQLSCVFERKKEIAPSLLSRVSKRLRKRKTVQQALRDNSWVRDISGSLPAEVIVKFLVIWDLTQNIQLQHGIPDAFRWLPGASGEYSAYQRFLAGSVYFEPGERIWKSWAPPKCKFFIWLASLNRCWTADRLARRGLYHSEKCVLAISSRRQFNTDRVIIDSIMGGSANINIGRTPSVGNRFIEAVPGARKVIA